MSWWYVHFCVTIDNNVFCSKFFLRPQSQILPHGDLFLLFPFYPNLLTIMIINLHCSMQCAVFNFAVLHHCCVVQIRFFSFPTQHQNNLQSSYSESLFDVFRVVYPLQIIIVITMYGDYSKSGYKNAFMAILEPSFFYSNSFSILTSITPTTHLESYFTPR